MTNTVRVIVTLSTLLALAPIAFAEPPPHPVPPTEAVDACVNRSVGDACTVTLHEQQMRGKCRTFPSGELACLPDAPPPPPPEAFSACVDAKEGDACTMSFRGHTLTGTCAPTPVSALACRPTWPPPAPPAR